MKVTFDTQTWEPMVFAERHTRHPDYAAMVKIKNAIRDGRIHGFICDSFATVEAIQTKNRAAYAAKKIPIVKTQATTTGPGSIAISINIESDHSLHPGLPPIQEAKLTEALAIGMRLLTAPYFNQPVPSLLLNNHAFYAPEVFATADYNERFGAVVSEIQSRGVGNAVLTALLNKIVQRLGTNRPNVLWEIQLLEHAYRNAKDQTEKREIEKAFAEGADGDAVAAHIAFGSEIFCTEDFAKSAPGASIFDASNRAWLEATYGVKFATMQELANVS